MSKSPAFQFYPRDWLGDPEIMLMDWDARAMHLHCMCIAWMQTDAYALPNDDEKLMRWLQVSDVDDWHKRLKPQIFAAWKLEGDQWIQSRLKREKIKQLEFSQKRKKAAESRWKNHAAPHDASALQVECSSSSSSSSTAVKKEEPKGSCRAEQKMPKPTADQARKILDRLNTKTGKAFEDVPSNLTPIKARLKEYGEEKLIAVIDAKFAEWWNDEKMSKYLRPSTLFNAEKCAQYVGELSARKVNGKDWRTDPVFAGAC